MFFVFQSFRPQLYQDTLKYSVSKSGVLQRPQTASSFNLVKAIVLPYKGKIFQPGGVPFIAKLAIIN
jgi:hypothetical protein